jgi:hypothetical protein
MGKKTLITHELISFDLNLPVCMTWSHSLGVNLIKTSPPCKYVITNASSSMFKRPSPLGSCQHYMNFHYPC